MPQTVKTAAELLASLDAAFKAVTDISDLGQSILQPQKFDQFVRRMEDRQVVLPDARFIPMDAQRTDIDRTGFIGRILRSGSDGAGASQTLAEGDFAQTTQATNQLNAVELQAVTSIRDRALRRNIERGNFENTLVDLFGEAAGRDFEEFALLADSNITHGDDDVLSKTDGWVARAGSRVFGRDQTAAPNQAQDFDPAGATFPENMFEAMLNALPKRFLQNVMDWRFYVTFEMLNSYRNLLRDRGTDLGDQAQTQGLPTNSVPFKGIPVVFAPLLERAQVATAGEVSGRLALLTHPDNMAWGVFHEVSIEQEREAKARRTDFVLTVEADADYEDENGAVAAFVDHDVDLAIA